MEEVLTVLQNGEITVRGEFLWGSNYTFLAQVEFENKVLPVVYKPSRGERPLWDFPPASLGLREVAAFWVSEALGWNMVPATVYRKDAPLGSGSLQLYIDHDPDYHYFNFSRDDRQRLRPVVLFDLLVNNADRKGSHVLIGPERRLWLIDHGLCFHVEDKLRTVIWDFVGEPIPEEYCAVVNDFRQLITTKDDRSQRILCELDKCLSDSELNALTQRANWLVSRSHFPPPDPHRRAFPWPQI